MKVSTKMSKPPTGEKTEAYDKHVRPLLARVLELCQEYDLPVVALVETDASDGGAYYVTSLQVDDAATPRMKIMARMIDTKSSNELFDVCRELIAHADGHPADEQTKPVKLN
jgi:hypothetical protein